MVFSPDAVLSEMAAIFGIVAQVAMSIFESVFGQAQGAFGNGPLVTGIIIGFVLALIMRGIVGKILMVIILVFVFAKMFGVPDFG